MDEQDKQELEMLRAFYLAWVGLHSMKRIKSNEEIMQIKAQMLVDAGHDVANFRKSRENKVILNG